MGQFVRSHAEPSLVPRNLYEYVPHPPLFRMYSPSSGSLEFLELYSTWVISEIGQEPSKDHFVVVAGRAKPRLLAQTVYSRIAVLPYCMGRVRALTPALAPL